MTVYKVGPYSLGEASEALRQQAKASGWTFELVNADGAGRRRVECANCNDERFLRFRVGKGAGTVEVVRHPCPLCNGDHTDLINALWQDSGVLHEHRGYRVDYFKGLPGREKAYAAACQILAMTPRPTGLQVYFGSFGTGKSGMMTAIVNQMVIAGVSARYVTMAGLIGEARQVYSKDGEKAESEAGLIARYMSYQVLAIDEFDRVSETSWAQEKIFAILGGRYDRRATCTTILATNLTPGSLGGTWAYLDDRMRDGLRIPFAGDSLRGAPQVAPAPAVQISTDPFYE